MLEDDTTLGMGIQLALQGPDVTIALTGTLSQAREMLAQKKFDLLILDVNLPDGSALDLLREVRQGEAVPVILLTANDLEMDVVTGLESGADNGPGIPEDEQPKVFQRFYRGLSNPTEEGVGIGLYLVRQIAEGQGGYVKVSSKPGEGSTFSLWLPREICQHC